MPRQRKNRDYVKSVIGPGLALIALLVIASYALLLAMVAQVCNLKVGEFVHTLGDAHLYTNHIDQAKLQLSRDFKTLPTLKINPDIKSIFDFKYEDFTIENYDPHPHIKASVAV